MPVTKVRIDTLKPNSTIYDCDGYAWTIKDIRDNKKLKHKVDVKLRTLNSDVLNVTWDRHTQVLIHTLV